MKQKITALVVEDEDAVIEVVSKKLKSMGHDFMIAKNQEEANSLIEKQTLDYILLDLKLPVDKKDMNPDSTTGFNLLQQIREKYDKTYLPIIIMTAYEKNTNSVVDAMKKGANDFIEKPFKSGELEKKIQTVLGFKDERICLADSHKFQEKGTEILKKRFQSTSLPSTKSMFKSQEKFDLIIDENLPNLMIICGKEVELTGTEFRFMSYMAKKPRQRPTSDQIINAVWGNRRDGGVQDQRIPSVKDDIHKKIKKIIPRYKTSKFIRNIRGVGWMLDVAPSKVKFIPEKSES